MEKFENNESVVIHFPEGATASGKVVNHIEDDKYLVMYIWNGWKQGVFHASQLTSFGTALFLVTESYQAQQTELAEVVD